MARLYADENFPLPIVQEMRALGHDVLSLHDSGNAGRSIEDEAVLSLATVEGRAILTLNGWHFIRLHHTPPAHAGIIACSFDPDFTAPARRINMAIETQPQLAGMLLRIGRPPG